MHCVEREQGIQRIRGEWQGSRPCLDHPETVEPLFPHIDGKLAQHGLAAVNTNQKEVLLAEAPQKLHVIPSRAAADVRGQNGVSVHQVLPDELDGKKVRASEICVLRGDPRKVLMCLHILIP